MRRRTDARPVLDQLGLVRRRSDIEDAAAERRVERSDGLAAVFRPGSRRQPEQAQPGGMAGLVLGGEVRVVVDVGVDEPQGDEAPVDAVVPLRDDLRDPAAGHPGEGADGVEVEVEVGVGHPWTLPGDGDLTELQVADGADGRNLAAGGLVPFLRDDARVQRPLRRASVADGCPWPEVPARAEGRAGWQ